MNVSKTELLRSTTRQQLAWNKNETLKLHSLDENSQQIIPNKIAKILEWFFQTISLGLTTWKQEKGPLYQKEFGCPQAYQQQGQS